MSDVRSPRGTLLCTIAAGIMLASATSSGAERSASSAPAASSASKASAGDKDLKEISNYKLTMEAVHKFAQANRTMEQFKKDHPELEKEDQDDDDTDNSESLADMEAKLNSVPGARSAIQSTGLSVHEYVVIAFALLQSGIAQYAVEQGADPAKIARDAGINPANVLFYKEHKAEIDALNTGEK